MFKALTAIVVARQSELALIEGQGERADNRITGGVVPLLRL
jgi:hypothetical protein